LWQRKKNKKNGFARLKGMESKMKRPVLYLLGFLICGIILGVYGSVFLFCLAFVLGLFLCIFLFRMYRYWPVLFFVLLILPGHWRVGDSLHNHVTYPIEDATISGIARDVGITGGGNQRVIIRLDNGVQVMAYIRPYLRWAQLGQAITVTGELHPLAGQQNPGGYSQFQHLRSQKVDSVIWAENVQVGEVRMSMTVALRMMRDRFAAIYDELLPMREAAVIRSMVLGDRADMDRDLADQYRAMGIFHILSISGLHVTILMLAFNKALGLFVEERKCGIIVLIVMVLYCLMTGASTATVRAVTMGGVLVFGKVLQRKYDLVTAVAWACVALLLYEPLFLFNVGFQLSFVAVFGIGILTTPVDRLLAKLRFPGWGEFRKGLAVGIAAVRLHIPCLASISMKSSYIASSAI